jgi:hypothetical protein
MGPALIADWFSAIEASETAETYIKPRIEETRRIWATEFASAIHEGSNGAVMERVP